MFWFQGQLVGWSCYAFFMIFLPIGKKGVMTRDNNRDSVLCKCNIPDWFIFSWLAWSKKGLFGGRGELHSIVPSLVRFKFSSLLDRLVKLLRLLLMTKVQSLVAATSYSSCWKELVSGHCLLVELAFTPRPKKKSFFLFPSSRFPSSCHGRNMKLCQFSQVVLRQRNVCFRVCYLTYFVFFFACTLLIY